ncbi:hypothetical protein RHMOL_Rhmol06G0111400 [Rhododendron molle]|uniref:Uncharacterized protein n=1 Tax=Rhododendron molle TaxID=49168 RepID=A0ACC0NBC9_RHOML|nr:hypothetical protein RHMOL_Rhmol06G0111400 [Rhododendron molle]
MLKRMMRSGWGGDNAQNADDEEDDEEQEIGREGGQCVTDSGNGGDNHIDSDSDSDFICGGLRDSSSSDGDDIEYVHNEGVDGDEGGCLPVRNFQEALGQGVVITEVKESDNSDENVSVGLTESMDLLFPGVEHRYCMRHKYSNFQKVHKGKELKDLMWEAASAYTLHEFRAKMMEVRAVDVKAHEWLLKEPPKYWARCFYSPRAKTNRMVNNLSESFNNSIKKVRDQPILTMMEGLKRYVMQRYVERTKFCNSFKTNICLSISKKLEIEKANAKGYSVMYCSTMKFEIRSPYKSWIVDIGLCTCTCKKWDESGVPCRHACAAMIKDRRKPEDFISPYYLTETFRNSYAYLINPIPDKSMWVHTEYDDIMPPPYKRKSSRYKKVRRKGADEESLSVQINKGNVSKCRKCNQPGHNSRTCKFMVGQSSTSPQLETRETSPCPLIPTGETMQRGRGVPKRRGVQRSFGRGLETAQSGVGRGATSAAATQRIVTRGLTNAQRGVGRGVARGIPNTAATTERIVIRGFANAQRGVARGVASTIGALRTVGTGVTRRKGVVRGLAVTATIGGESVVGTGGARTTRSTTFGDVRAVQIGGARSDRDGATRTGGTTDGAKTVEAGTMLRQGKKIYLKSQQTQQAWKIARIGDGVFSSKATKGWTKGSTQ